MNLLFDLDGTLTDPFEGITRSIVHALDEMGRPHPPQAQLGWCIGPPLIDSFAVLLGPDEAHRAAEALNKYRERFGTAGLFENRVYEGIPDMLQTLNENGHTLYLATSKPTVYAARIIDHFGLARYFSHVYGSELDGRRSDKTSLIAHILEKESIDRTSAAMIGDREHDIIGARANDIQGFGVLWGFGSKAELTASGARACFDHARDLLDAFGGSSLPAET